MKHILLLFAMLAGIQFSFAGNGNGDGTGSPSCNCALPNEVNIYATGTAQIIGSWVNCVGQGGTCWEVNYTPEGGWILTIYTRPPVILGSKHDQDDPPGTLNVMSKGDGYVIYEIGNEWKKQ